MSWWINWLLPLEPLQSDIFPAKIFTFYFSSSSCLFLFQKSSKVSSLNLCLQIKHATAAIDLPWMNIRWSSSQYWVHDGNDFNGSEQPLTVYLKIDRGFSIDH